MTVYVNHVRYDCNGISCGNTIEAIFTLKYAYSKTLNHTNVHINILTERQRKVKAIENNAIDVSIFKKLSSLHVKHVLYFIVIYKCIMQCSY